MTEAANAVEEYVELQRNARWRSVPAKRLELVRKSYAQQLARSASQSVSDRHRRAELKAQIYNHLMPLLELHAREQAASSHYYRRIILALTAGLLVTTVTSTLLLLFG